MKTIALSAAALALLTLTALRRSPVRATPPAQRDSGTVATSGSGVQVAPRGTQSPGFIKGNDVYDCTGKYPGSDPDPKIRQQLYREGDQGCQGNPTLAASDPIERQPIARQSGWEERDNLDGESVSRR